jgi:hypothetical protein
MKSVFPPGSKCETKKASESSHFCGFAFGLVQKKLLLNAGSHAYRTRPHPKPVAAMGRRGCKVGARLTPLPTFAHHGQRARSLVAPM